MIRDSSMYDFCKKQIKFLVIIFLSSLSLLANANTSKNPAEPPMKIEKTKQEWKEILPPEVFYITRENGTERAFSGKYDKFYEKGKYLCSNCKNHLFDSSAKYDSGTGWPSFYDYANDYSIETKLDKGNLFLPDRTEVICWRCSAHLGHVFDDGPQPTGLRYCMNSLALHFEPES